MSERERMLDTIMEMQKWNIKKDKDIEILEKALELACDELCCASDAMENLIFPNKKLNEIVDYFKTKAKEMRSE